MARPSHQWDISGVKHMKIENEETRDAGSLPMILEPLEAERLVESLKKFNIEEIGNSGYLQQVNLLLLLLFVTYFLNVYIIIIIVFVIFLK